MLRSIFLFFSQIVFIYLCISCCYLFILALAGRFLKGKQFVLNDLKKRIMVLIPCFKEDHIILDTAARAREHNYPQDLFTVVVIADKLQPSTIEKLKQIPVHVLEVDVSMKSRSIHAALASLMPDAADIIMILDADNIMAAGCLEKINDAFQKGYAAVQCHRTAKNKNTPVALLDAISEEININLFRRGPSTLGLSAAPIGSGMAFDFLLVKEIFSTEEILNNPGEDREIDLFLMRRKIKMEFIDDAYVLDEKVSSSGVFEKQRIRWLEAQVNHVRRFFHSDIKKAPKSSMYYNKFFQNLLLPRILLMLLFCIVLLMLLAQWIFSFALLSPSWIWWLATIAVFVLTLLISIPASYYSLSTLRAILHIPSLMFSMVKALFQVRKNRKEFLHTPKSFTEP